MFFGKLCRDTLICFNFKKKMQIVVKVPESDHLFKNLGLQAMSLADNGLCVVQLRQTVTLKDTFPKRFLVEELHSELQRVLDVEITAFICANLLSFNDIDSVEFHQERFNKLLKLTAISGYAAFDLL